MAGLFDVDLSAEVVDDDHRPFGVDDPVTLQTDFGVLGELADGVPGRLRRQHLEAGEAVPELFHQLKTWLNVYVQWMVNPIAFLSFIAIAVVSLRSGVLPGWAAWGVIVWGAVWFFIPFLLALFPVPVFLGAMLLING